MSGNTTSGSEQCHGRVKWFNNKAGYGFITVSEGPVEGDVFVHHSALSVSEEQYKYLVQGEYVEFKLSRVEGGKHEWQATSVGGCNGGKLMCETRREVRNLRVSRTSSSTEEKDTRPKKTTRQYQRVKSEVHQPRHVPSSSVRQGPRDDDGTQWMLVRCKNQEQPHRHKSSRSPRYQPRYEQE